VPSVAEPVQEVPVEETTKRVAEARKKSEQETQKRAEERQSGSSGNFDATKKAEQDKESEETAKRMHEAFNTAKAMEQDVNTAEEPDLLATATPKLKVQRSCGASCVIS